MSKHVPQHAHGHGHIDATGKGHHDSTHADSKVAAGSQIGQPFTPMVATPPVLSLTTPHKIVTHLACGSRILHDGRNYGFACQGCQGTVDDASALC